MQTSEWQTEKLSRSFLDGVRGAIPGADLQFTVIGKITEQWCPKPKSILDLGCGDGVLGRYLLSLFPRAHCTFADFSEPMLAAAREKLKTSRKVTVVQADFATPKWLQSVAEGKPFDIVISGFSIHHQIDRRKRVLYREIFNALKPGGVFLNLEHVASATTAGEKLFDDFFVDALHQFHRKRDPSYKRAAISRNYYNRPDKKENILAPVELQCDWLRRIGFIDVDCFFKTFELALFGGRKR